MVLSAALPIARRGSSFSPRGLTDLSQLQAHRELIEQSYHAAMMLAVAATVAFRVSLSVIQPTWEYLPNIRQSDDTLPTTI